MFYAVAKGRKPGIYKTWQETKLQVIGVSALHKKFKTLDEAKAFLGPHLDSTFIDSCVASLNSASNTRPLLGSVSCTNSTNTRPSSLNLKNTSVHTSNPKNSSLDSYIDVYTDGSCLSNGQQGAQAGLGVFYGVNDPRNISERVPGAQTNNRGELLAPIRVLQGTTGPVKIHSDSKYVIDGVTKYLAHWKRNNFTTAKKTPVANQELWELLDSLMVGRNIKWVHVAAHTGIHGNEEADRLANVGALLPPPVDILRNNASRFSGDKKKELLF